jgi:hypothetical protein
MKLKQLALFAVALAMSMVSLSSFAGTGWYMTVVNNSNQTITVANSGDDCWYVDDLGGSGVQVAPNGGQQRIYTEMKNSGGCNKFLNGSWVQGFKIMVGGQQVFNAEQLGTYDGHFGTCTIQAQSGYSFPAKSTGCEEAESTITAEFDFAGTPGNYSASVPSITCTGSVQCHLSKKEAIKRAKAEDAADKKGKAKH